MSYDKIRLRTGGKIPKLLGGGDTDFGQMGTVEYWLAKGKTANEAQALAANFNEMKYGNAQDLKFQTPDLSYQPGIKSQVSFTGGDPNSSFGQFTTTIDNLTGKATTTNTKIKGNNYYTFIIDDPSNNITYQNNPRFIRFMNDNNLPFESYESFGKQEIIKRRELYKKIVDIIWNIDNLKI